MLKTEITTATLFVHLFLHFANCQASEVHKPPLAVWLERMSTTAKYITESVDILLDALESLDLETCDSEDHERNLRGARLTNKSMYRLIMDLYESSMPHVNINYNTTEELISQEELKEWKHVVNYSLVLKETLEKFVGRTFNATNGNVDNDCLLMPVGPPRDLLRLLEPPKANGDGSVRETEKQLNAATEQSDLRLIKANALDALFARFYVFEYISYAMADLSDTDMEAAEKSFRDEHKTFWGHLKKLVTCATSAPDLAVDESIVKKTKTLTRLALTIRDTTVALDLHMYDRKYVTKIIPNEKEKSK